MRGLAAGEGASAPAWVTGALRLLSGGEDEAPWAEAGLGGASAVRLKTRERRWRLFMRWVSRWREGKRRLASSDSLSGCRHRVRRRASRLGRTLSSLKDTILI